MTNRETEAASKLAQANRDISALLKVIADSLVSCSPETAHWGHVGSAAHVREQLLEVACFLEGGKSETVQRANVLSKIRGGCARTSQAARKPASGASGSEWSAA